MRGVLDDHFEMIAVDMVALLSRTHVGHSAAVVVEVVEVGSALEEEGVHEERGGHCGQGSHAPEQGGARLSGPCCRWRVVVVISMPISKRHFLLFQR